MKKSGVNMGKQLRHSFYGHRVAVVAAAVLLAGFGSVHTAQAGVCSTCQTYQTALENEFSTHQNWMTDEWWKGNVEPGLKSFSDEVRNSMMLEIAAFGSFLDAQNQMGAQRAIQEMAATTLKNYTASDSICKFGTLSRSLALSESKGKLNQLVLSERSQRRQLLQQNMSSADGDSSDSVARLNQFKKTFCDPGDFGGGMKGVCEGTTSDARRNVDINFTRAIDAKPTLNVDFSDTTAPTADEEDVIALANNLYANKVFERMNVGSLNNTSTTDRQSTYLDQRSIIAKRSVAENSFNNLVGSKSRGGAGSQAYFVQVLQSLGLSADDAKKYVGDAPSYDAQMEILTKKLYQDPAFYASLMESPANVSRQYAALQSFGLMQKRDIFETVSRSEMLLSLLLEMEIAKYQDNIQNRQN